MISAQYFLTFVVDNTNVHSACQAIRNIMSSGNFIDKKIEEEIPHIAFAIDARLNINTVYRTVPVAKDHGERVGQYLINVPVYRTSEAKSTKKAIKGLVEFREFMIGRNVSTGEHGVHEMIRDVRMSRHEKYSKTVKIDISPENVEAIDMKAVDEMEKVIEEKMNAEG